MTMCDAYVEHKDRILICLQNSVNTQKVFQQNSTIQNVKELFTFLEKYSREMSEISWREGDGEIWAT